MEKVIQLRKIRDFGESLSDSIQFLKINWKNLILLYLIFVVPLLLIATLLGASSFSYFFSRLGDMAESSNFMNASLFSGQIFVAIALYVLATSAYATVINIYMRLYEEKGGQFPTISEVGRMFPAKLIANFGYMLLVGLMMVTLAFFVIVPILGWLVFLVGIFFLAVNFSILFPVNTMEDNPFGQPVSRCFTLIKNKWWYTFGFVIILTLIYYFFSMIISLAVNMIFGFTSINFLDPKGTSMFTERYFFISGLSAIVSQIFYLIIYVGLGIHYYSLKEEKEGSGLEERLEQLGTNGGIHGETEEQY